MPIFLQQPNNGPKKKRNAKIMLNCTHASKLKDFVSKLLKLSHTERLK